MSELEATVLEKNREENIRIVEDTNFLKEAFTQFNASASELEQSYRLLKAEVRHLKQALSESHIEKERLREESERNHRLAVVGEMATRMAHELRNPLGSIELFASLIRKELAGNPEKQQWTDHLKTAVTSMDYAITNLLLFTGKPQAQCREVDLGQLIATLHPFVVHRLEQQRINWQNQIGHSDAGHATEHSIWCDEDLMRQVLLNLIINAIDAMPKGGCLSLSAKKASKNRQGENPQETVIIISDTGSGIPKDTISHVFDPFFTTKKTGTGLGLSIVQNALAAHGGSIQVESTKDGTDFTLYLPPRLSNKAMKNKTE